MTMQIAENDLAMYVQPNRSGPACASRCCVLIEFFQYFDATRAKSPEYLASHVGIVKAV